jgi:hypothetical protein
MGVRGVIRCRRIGGVVEMHLSDGTVVAVRLRKRQ